jgi:hypothetical protein
MEFDSGKSIFPLTRYRVSVPIPGRGRSFMVGGSSGTKVGFRAWVGVVSIIGLMLASTLVSGGAQAAVNKFVYHVGDDFLASVNPAFAPDFALSTATGDRLQLSGTGTFNAGARRVDGGGTFVHRLADGSVFADGSWVAIGIVSWKSYGNGVPQGLPPNFFGGVLVIAIEVHPNLPGDPVLQATLRVDCVIGHPPAGAEEGIQVNVPAFPISFDHEDGGATLFVLSI